MTSLYKLSVQGVRSYDPETPARIEFFHPLTLIVGSNGCGKTTILEALRYICGGQEPPNADRGKNFVHDPKAAGTSSVKAKIMLAFKTPAHWDVLVSRVMQVTQMKTKATFKLLDNTVSVTDAQGERREMTNKCGDMAKLVPGLLGTSKAILDNVIFCHQEESNWPLAEDRILKQKFDDIFAATSYSKLLVQLKAQRQEKAKASRETLHRLELLSQQLEQSRQLSEELGRVQERVQQCLGEMQRFKDQREPLVEEKERLESCIAELSESQKAWQELEHQKELMEREKDLCFSRLTNLYDESIQELNEFLSRQGEMVQTKQRMVEEMQNELKRQRDDRQALETELASLQESGLRAGILHKDVEQLEAQEEALLQDFEGDETRLQRRLQELEELHASSSSSDLKVQEHLRAKTILEEKVKSMQTRLQTVQLELDECQEEASTRELSPIDEGRAAELVQRLSTLRQQLVGAESQDAQTQVQKELAELREALHALPLVEYSESELVQQSERLSQVSADLLQLAGERLSKEKERDALLIPVGAETDLEALEEEVHTLTRRLTFVSAAKALWDRFEARARRDGECSLCKRELSPQELQKLVSRLQGKQAQAEDPALQGTLQQDLDAATEKLRVAQEQALVGRKRQELTAALAALDQREHRLLELQSSLAQAPTLLESLRQTQQLTQSCAQLESRLAALQSAPTTESILRSIEEAQAEQSRVAEKRHALSALGLSRANRKRRQRLLEEAKELKEQCALSEAQLDEVRARVEQATLRESRQKSQRQLLESELLQVSSVVRQLQSIQQSVRGKREELTTLQAHLPDLAEKQARLATLRSSVASLESEVAQQAQALGSLQLNLKDVELNVEYKERVQALEGISANLCHSRGGELAALQEQLASVSRQLESVALQKAELQGRLGTEQTRAQDLRRQLAEPRFHGLEDSFRRASIEQETLAMVIQDLDQTCASLDEAVLSFHQQKTEELNVVLRALWTSTYQGKDIEYIALRSAVGESRKAYSYRVVMCCGGRELDMRGRCSAGQRVLACILIRLALSETFCVNCGVLMLDEPTTNLDARNIRALADALHSILERRKGQKSFQLIVITHDEEFVTRLHARDHADYYYLVSKDARAHSRISQQPLYRS